MTSVTLDCPRILEALQHDKEFLLSARRWSVRIQLHVGGDVFYLRVVDGVPVRFTDDSDGYEPCDSIIAAPAETWMEVLRSVPQPFYQDLYSARARHDLTMTGDLDDLFAHYGAVRRLTDILRTRATYGANDA